MNLSPQIEVVSPIAEGADRLIAVESISLGLPLVCLLPFARDDYVRDFTDQASVDEYRQLLSQAERVVELPGVQGTSAEREDAYAALSDALVDEVDLLVAIWDGEQSRGRGGTGESVHRALSRGIPVVWIRAQPPHVTTLLCAQVDGSVKRIEPGELAACLSERSNASRK